MPDYKAMYFKLFNDVTDAVSILQEAQLEGESTYITSNDGPVLIPLVIPPEKPEDSESNDGGLLKCSLAARRKASGAGSIRSTPTMMTIPSAVKTITIIHRP